MIGSKAENLIRLRDEFNLNVPEFEVLTLNSVFTDFETRALDHTYLKEVFQSLKSRGFQRVSFRTSGALEDSIASSFAGQYETYLDVLLTEESLEAHVSKCFESMVSERVKNYAAAQKIDFVIDGSVVIQKMFYGNHSGVIFSENGAGQLSISWVDSWRNTVVEGSDSHELLVNRHELEYCKIDVAFQKLCDIALKLEADAGLPVDIEWASNGSELAILQFRPITVPNLEYFLEWDSTNISENYPGVTLPLTYSVIRELYAGVYPAFLRLIGTNKEVLKTNQAVFDNMLGYLDGHVYYRISSWYDTLKLLPGKRNQEYFEAMLNPVKKRGASQSYATRIDLKSVAALLRFMWLMHRSEAYSKKFKEHINERIQFYSSYKLDFLNAATLINSAQQIRDELLEQWAVPILNDVKLMVFHGILKSKFFAGGQQSEYLEFLKGLTDRASLKPLEGLRHLGDNITQLMQAERVSTAEELQTTKSWQPALAAVIEYNKHFGARTPDELKLENIRLSDSTLDLMNLALKAAQSEFAPAAQSNAISWPQHVKGWQRPILKYVAEHTRKAIDWRERFRYNRSQTFNLSRNAFDAVGRIMASEGMIESARDIYWLTQTEIFELVNGHAWQLDAKEIVANRKRQFSTYEKTAAPLAIHGAGRIATVHRSAVKSDATDQLGGNGVAPGELKAEVLVATAFDANLDVRGKILVVHHIDPGWTLLFTQAAGIIAERGNALSHAAIIAREIGIPCIVAAVSVTSALKTGEIVSMNGTTGVISREAN